MSGVEPEKQENVSSHPSSREPSASTDLLQGQHHLNAEEPSIELAVNISDNCVDGNETPWKEHYLCAKVSYLSVQSVVLKKPVQVSLSLPRLPSGVDEVDFRGFELRPQLVQFVDSNPPSWTLEDLPLSAHHCQTQTHRDGAARNILMNPSGKECRLSTERPATIDVKFLEISSCFDPPSDYEIRPDGERIPKYKPNEKLDSKRSFSVFRLVAILALRQTHTGVVETVRVDGGQIFRVAGDKTRKDPQKPKPMREPCSECKKRPMNRKCQSTPKLCVVCCKLRACKEHWPEGKQRRFSDAASSAGGEEPSLASGMSGRSGFPPAFVNLNNRAPSTATGAACGEEPPISDPAALVNGLQVMFSNSKLSLWQQNLLHSAVHYIQRTAGLVSASAQGSAQASAYPQQRSARKEETQAVGNESAGLFLLPSQVPKQHQQMHQPHVMAPSSRTMANQQAQHNYQSTPSNLPTYRYPTTPATVANGMPETPGPSPLASTPVVHTSQLETPVAMHRVPCLYPPQIVDTPISVVPQDLPSKPAEISKSPVRPGQRRPRCESDVGLSSPTRGDDVLLSPTGSRPTKMPRIDKSESDRRRRVSITNTVSNVSNGVAPATPSGDMVSPVCSIGRGGFNALNGDHLQPEPEGSAPSKIQHDTSPQKQAGTQPDESGAFLHFVVQNAQIST